MSERFFIALTSEPQDGVFLLVGHNIQKQYALAFCLEEKERDRIEFGHIIHVDLNGQMKMHEDVGLCHGTLIGVEAQRPPRQDATAYLESAHAYMIDNGWTEDVETDSLSEVLDEMEAALSHFPEM